MEEKLRAIGINLKIFGDSAYFPNLFMSTSDSGGITRKGYV
jgi:hypothetical protein